MRSMAAPRAAHRRPTCQHTEPVNPAWMPRSRQRGRDLGLRESEMLNVKVKHVDFENWKITLPPETAKGGATTDRPEFVYAMTPRIREVLEERKDLGAEKFVFGAESGAFVASFDKSWQQLFRHAGLPEGRKRGLTWHDLRHEFVSFLVDCGAEIHEAKEA